MVSEAGISFNQIISSIKKVTDQILEISATSEQLSASSQQVSASVTEMASIAKVSADRSGSVLEAAENQTSSTKEILVLAESLNDLAKELKNATEKFQIN